MDIYKGRIGNDAAFFMAAGESGQMTTYAEYAAGGTNIQFAKGVPLVLGFLVTYRSDETGAEYEIRYAVHPRHGIKQSESVRSPCHDFNSHGRLWHKVDTVPLGAVFIGHYPQDMFSRAAVGARS